MPEAVDSPDAIVSGLRAAALAAICALTFEHGLDGTRDANQYTPNMTPYDLARIFNFDPAGQRGNVPQDLNGIAEVVRHSSQGAKVRQRAQWVAEELMLMGHPDEAAVFTAIANDRRFTQR